MNQDLDMLKFLYLLLAVASILVPGPIIPIGSFFIAICILVYKIKRAKESPEGFADLMLDMIILIIVIIVDIGVFALTLPLETEYDDSSKSSYSKNMSTSDIAERVIALYQLENYSQFSGKKNNLAQIKSGFVKYLKEELNLTDVKVNGNKITCKIDKDTVVFTVSKDDIEYEIK